MQIGCIIISGRFKTQNVTIILKQLLDFDYLYFRVRVSGVMVFNDIFNNISVIS
jgi:hypothetical protein